MNAFPPQGAQPQRKPRVKFRVDFAEKLKGADRRTFYEAMAAELGRVAVQLESSELYYSVNPKVTQGQWEATGRNISAVTFLKRRFEAWAEKERQRLAGEAS